MEEQIQKIKKHYSDNQPIFLLTGAVLVLIVAFGAYSQIELIQTRKEKQVLENQVGELEKKITTLDSDLRLILGENQSLSALLSDEQTRVYELERETRRNEREIDELTKLTTLDPELLKKYSKVFFLSENYEPRELEEVDDKYKYDQTKKVEVLEDIVPFLEDMLDEAEEEEIDIKIVSAYRSFETQKSLKDVYTVTYGANTANKFSAEQGYSEHQLGTTLDFTTSSLAGGQQGFDKTPAYTWLTDNAYKYGFILSYPKDNAYYVYEPWHWRFVGQDLARKLHREEEYFYEWEQRDIDEYLLEIFD